MTTKTYRVEALKAESASGEQTWELAARWQMPGSERRMSYGPAERLTLLEAEYIVEKINASAGVAWGMARIVPEAG